MKKLLAFVAPTAIAVALGPLVAGLTLCLVTLVLALIAAAGCWLLTRRFAPAAAKHQT